MRGGGNLLLFADLLSQFPDQRGAEGGLREGLGLLLTSLTHAYKGTSAQTGRSGQRCSECHSNKGARQGSGIHVTPYPKSRKCHPDGFLALEAAEILLSEILDATWSQKE